MSTSTFKELRNLMSQFLDDIESAIKNIHVAHGVDNDAITKQVADAVATGIAPLQTQVSDLQGKVAELQKAAQDTVAALNSGDTATAHATATAAANTAPTGSDLTGTGTIGAVNGTAH